MLNKYKLIVYAISALLTIGGAFVLYTEYKGYQRVKAELSIEKSNVLAYQDIVAGDSIEKRVLRLSADDLRHSNDKLIHSLDSIKKSRKGATNKPGDVSSGVVTGTHVTGEITIVRPQICRFDTIVKPNSETTLDFCFENNSFNYDIAINNMQSLFVYSTREYVNKYDGWFKGGLNRLVHLDWKKEDVLRYEIENSNKLVKVKDIRVIKVE